MQGRQGQGSDRKDPLDRSATAGYRFSEELEKYRKTGSTGAYRLSDLTGRQPVIPQRPPGMSPHVDQPPPTPRVARPPREERRPRKRRSPLRWFLITLVVVLVCVIIGGVVYGVTNFFFAVSANLGPANTASDFLASLQGADYDQAYSDLGAAITVQLSKSDFTQMAMADDHCYGRVTNYNEVSGSAITSPDGGTQSFAYTMTRGKLTKPYQLKLTLQKDASGTWSISDYGTDLGPAPPTCS